MLIAWEVIDFYLAARHPHRSQQPAIGPDHTVGAGKVKRPGPVVGDLALDDRRRQGAGFTGPGSWHLVLVSNDVDGFQADFLFGSVKDITVGEVRSRGAGVEQDNIPALTGVHEGVDHAAKRRDAEDRKSTR